MSSFRVGDAFRGLRQPLKLRLQFQHFDRTSRPIVFPTNDQVALVGVMTVCPERSRPELELDPQTLPNPRSDLPLRLAVGKTLPHDLDHVAKLATHHAKEKNHALFIDR